MREWINLIESISGVTLTVTAYHGSHSRFDRLEASTGLSGVQSLGVWFTDSFDVAKFFALDGNHADYFGEEEAWVTEARLSFDKALVVHGWKEGLHQAAEAVLEPYNHTQYENAFAAFKARLLDEGFDGIVIEDCTTDNAGTRTDFVVLDPSKITITNQTQIEEPHRWDDE